MMIGTRLRPARMARTASMPFISGISMSIVTRSGLSCSSLPTATLPFTAVPTTSMPGASDSTSVTILRTTTESSTTITLIRSTRRSSWILLGASPAGCRVFIGIPGAVLSRPPGSGSFVPGGSAADRERNRSVSRSGCAARGTSRGDRTYGRHRPWGGPSGYRPPPRRAAGSVGSNWLVPGQSDRTDLPRTRETPRETHFLRVLRPFLRIVEMSTRKRRRSHRRQTVVPGSATAGEPQPGRAQHGERGLVEQVAHDHRLHAPGDGVPPPVRAVAAVEAAVEERAHGVQLRGGQRAGAPGDVGGPAGVVHRRGPRPVLGAAVVGGRAPRTAGGAVRARDRGEQLLEPRRGRTEVGK